MFPTGFSTSHMVVILAIALIVVGPKNLPKMLRQVGQFVGRMRSMANDFRTSFEDMARQSELDEIISRHSKGWAIGRIAPLERAILRVALLEMLHPEVADADTPIPPEGAIDEAVETAKSFCGAQAPGFINGILDAALREMNDNPQPG